MSRSLSLVSMLLLGIFASGCALLTKSDPVVPRYFSPELAESPSRTNKTTDGRKLSLRLGRVGGGSYLKERMVYRDTIHEFGFYEDRRWTERPEVYLQRALETSLFEDGGMRRSLSSTAPTLTADLVEFEEVRGSLPHVRLRVTYALHDEQTVFFERTIAVERPLGGGLDAARPDRVAAALGEALQEAVSRVSGEVAAGLTSPDVRSPESGSASAR
jgi:cholesterol transport system auxiliary component